MRRRNPPEAKVKAGSFTAKLRERTADGWHNTTAKLDGYLSANGLWFIHKAVKGGPLGLNNAWVLMYTPNSGLWPFNEPQTSASIKKLLADMPPELYNAADPMDMQDYASDFLHSRRRNPAHEGDREQRIAAIHTAQTARGPRYTVHFGYARWVKGEFTAAKARKASQTFTSRAKADAASDKWIAKGV